MPHCKRAKSRFIIEVYNKSDLLRGWSFSVGKNRPHDLIYYKGGFIIMVFIIRVRILYRIRGTLKKLELEAGRYRRPFLSISEIYERLHPLLGPFRKHPHFVISVTSATGRLFLQSASPVHPLHRDQDRKL